MAPVRPVRTARHRFLVRNRPRPLKASAPKRPAPVGIRQTCWIATCHGFQRPFYKACSASRGAAAGTLERPYHHSVAFDKSGRHRANRLAAPAVCRDGPPVPMQKIGSPTNRSVNANLDIRFPSLWPLQEVALVKEKARCETGLSGLLNSNAVIIVHRTTPRRIVPIPSVVITIFWRSFELLLRYSAAIAAEVRVVFQRLPGQGVVVVDDSEETAETQEDVC